MFHHFHVNVGNSWSFEVDESSLVMSLGGPNGTSRADSSTLLRDALATPLDFPELGSASVPGDRIVVAPDPLLPDAPAALLGVVDALLRTGAEPELITVVFPPSLAELADDWPQLEERADLSEIQRAVHDPANRSELAYLAATEEGRPIYVNRLLCDADLLIPVTCVPPPSNPRWLGIYGSLYPAFSDHEAAGRYRLSLERLSPAQHERSCREIDEVGWLLGVCVVIGVVPGREGTIHSAAVGTPQRVRDHCVEIARKGWRRELPRRAPLVIALVGDRGGTLLWDDFAAALSVARQTAGRDGAVAVCGNFTKRPGRSLRRLVDVQDLHRAEDRLHRDAHEDTWAAQELAAALQRGPVYFAGGLAEELVEGLGMAPIQRPEELQRLASRFDECIVISDAQIAAPYLPEDSRRSHECIA